MKRATGKKRRHNKTLDEFDDDDHDAPCTCAKGQSISKTVASVPSQTDMFHLLILRVREHVLVVYRNCNI